MRLCNAAEESQIILFAWYSLRALYCRAFLFPVMNNYIYE